MKLLTKGLLGAAALGALVYAPTSASAAIACVGPVCWHAQESYEYPPDARVTIHGDDWRAGPDVRFREHEGRGYWKDDRWNEW